MSSGAMLDEGREAREKAASMDAREATRLVKEYFEETNGPFGTVLFQVQSVEPGPEEGSWEVRCSFIPGVHTTSRDHFYVLVRPDKSFARVEKTSPDTF